MLSQLLRMLGSVAPLDYRAQSGAGRLQRLDDSLCAQFEAGIVSPTDSFFASMQWRVVGMPLARFHDEAAGR
jgi:hypothetical protein